MKQPPRRRPNARPDAANRRTADPRPALATNRALPRPSNHLIFGRNPVEEVLKHAPERILVVYIASRGANAGDRRNHDLVEALQHRRIEVRQVAPDALTTLCESDAHQSFVAFLKERQPIDLGQFIKSVSAKERSTIIALDSVFDPHNIGAVMRASECFGADAILWSKNRGGDVSAAVGKTSAGASELIKQVVVSNLVDGLRKLKEAGFWIVGAHGATDSQDLTTFDWPQKSVIVLGSEGQGLHRLVLETCDFSVKIPLFGRIESLNVSQAAAVLLFASTAMRRQSS